MMKIKEKEFEMNLEEGLVDFSSKKPKNGGGGNGRKNEKKNIRNFDPELTSESVDLFEQPLVQFDVQFSEDLKVLQILHILLIFCKLKPCPMLVMMECM
jgi:hypothetical protein